ncbi:hypothetical protein ED312_01615, partial [Sinomicrobium pectinilyticum]
MGVTCKKSVFGASLNLKEYILPGGLEIFYEYEEGRRIEVDGIDGLTRNGYLHHSEEESRKPVKTVKGEVGKFCFPTSPGG